MKKIMFTMMFGYLSVVGVLFYLLSLPICPTEDSDMCIFLNKNGTGFSFISLWTIAIPSWVPIILAVCALVILFLGTTLMETKDGIKKGVYS